VQWSVIVQAYSWFFLRVVLTLLIYTLIILIYYNLITFYNTFKIKIQNYSGRGCRYLKYLPCTYRYVSLRLLPVFRWLYWLSFPTVIIFNYLYIINNVLNVKKNINRELIIKLCLFQKNVTKILILMYFVF